MTDEIKAAAAQGDLSAQGPAAQAAPVVETAKAPNADRHLLLTVARAVKQIAHIVGTSDHSEAIAAALADVDGEAKADAADSHGDEQS